MFIPFFLVVFSQLLTKEDLKLPKEHDPTVKTQFVSNEAGHGLSIHHQEHAIEILGNATDNRKIIFNKKQGSQSMQGSALYRYRHSLKSNKTGSSDLSCGIGGGYQLYGEEIYLPTVGGGFRREATSGLVTTGYEKRLIDGKVFFVQVNLGLPLTVEEESLMISTRGIKTTQFSAQMDTPEPTISVGLTY